MVQYIVDLLERRLWSALEEANNHIGIYEEFTEDMVKHHNTQLMEWRSLICAYESHAPGVKSPYEIEGESTSRPLFSCETMLELTRKLLRYNTCDGHEAAGQGRG